MGSRGPVVAVRVGSLGRARSRLLGGVVLSRHVVIASSDFGGPLQSWLLPGFLGSYVAFELISSLFAFDCTCSLNTGLLNHLI